MQFNSIGYAVFLPLALLANRLAPSRWRWAVWLIFSYYFYMSWNPKLIVLILFTTLVSYGAALGIEKCRTAKGKNAVLASGCLVCFACLFFFKYFNFAAASITAVCRLLGFSPQPVTLSLILPVGISFYTFQTVSYLVDIYRGRMKAERHFGYYALYVSFFPQLVAGPIERADRLLPQLHSPHRVTAPDATAGMQLLLSGLAKKIVIADTLSPYVDAVYNALPGKTGLTLLFATFLFAVQIYCDFSGYSEIAIGSARLLGIDLMDNFRQPYFARSIREFWRRWHISLTSWFTDYVYIPLGGSRCKKGRHLVNLLITFLLSGLWHGAAWHFVAWGLYHGIWLCLEQLYMPKADALQTRLAGKPTGAVLSAVRTIYTVFLATLGWVFFRANSLADAGYIFQNIFRGLNPLRLPAYMAAAGMDTNALCRVLVLLLLLAVCDGAAYYGKTMWQRLNAARPAVRYAAYYGTALLILLALLLQPYGTAAEFIYFQF